MKIQNGQTLPSIPTTLDGEVVDLANETAGTWTALLLYRGHW